MDPDFIFIFLIWFIYLGFTIGAIIGLSRKIGGSRILKVYKALLICLIPALLVIAVYKFVTLNGDTMYYADILFYYAAFLISLNLSINIASKYSTVLRKKFSLPIFILLMTAGLTIAIPYFMYAASDFFDKLNLMGNGG